MQFRFHRRETTEIFLTFVDYILQDNIPLQTSCTKEQRRTAFAFGRELLLKTSFLGEKLGGRKLNGAEDKVRLSTISLT